MAAKSQLNRNVWVFAVVSRLITVTLQILFNAIIPDHDAGVFNPPVSKDSTEEIADRLTEFLFGGFRRWDAVYLLHITEYGYTYENCLAFFPLYPVLVSTISVIVCLFPVPYSVQYHNVVLIWGVIINWFLFVETSTALFELGQKVTNNDRIAYVGALLFCINPACIFMTAPYSEILFLYLSVQGMLNLECNNKFLASVFFGLSCIARSNGLLNIGYLAYKILKLTISQVSILKQGMFTSLSNFYTTIWVILSVYIIPYTFLLIISVIPFLIYQYYCYVVYCEFKSISVNIPDHIRDYVQQRPYLKLFGEEKSPWCYDTVPLAYSYIQKHYWEQGFLNYWKWKNVPHFLLAMPVAILSLGAAVTFYRQNRYICRTLGLDDAGTLKKQLSHDLSCYRLEGEKLLPYVLHAVALTVFGLFFIHVQVLTRLLFSSTPILYWYTAMLLFPETKKQVQTNQWDVRSLPSVQVEDERNIDGLSNLLTEKISSFKSLKLLQKLIIMYFIGYYVIGIALFSNFLPWT